MAGAGGAGGVGDATADGEADGEVAAVGCADGVGDAVPGDDTTGGFEDAGGVDTGGGVVLPPQAVSAISRIEMEIVSSFLPRLYAVFFNAILLFLIFQNSRWT